MATRIECDRPVCGNEFDAVEGFTDYFPTPEGVSLSAVCPECVDEVHGWWHGGW